MSYAIWRALRSKDGNYSSPVRPDPERAAMFKREASIERQACKVEDLIEEGPLTQENIDRLRAAVEFVAAQPLHAWPDAMATELAEVRATAEAREQAVARVPA